MRANSWLYHYYLVQTKLQYGMNYEGQQASAGTSRSSAASASSPAGSASFGNYQPAASTNSPGPSSSCSASGETPTTPQPAFQQPQQLVPAPIASPLYAPPPPPPPPHHLHPHGHLYSDSYHHFPMQQQTNAPGNYAFSPGHHQGYLGGSFQNTYHHLHALPAHQQAHLIKSESFGEPAEHGVYQVTSFFG